MIYDIVLRNILRRKLRTSLTVLGISIGILLVVTLNSFSESINSTVNAELGFLSGIVTVVSEGVGFENFQGSELDVDLVEDIEGISGVERVAPALAGSVPGIGMVFGARIDDIDILSIDVEPEEGRWPEDETGEILVGIDYSESKDIKTDDELEIRAVKYTVSGVLARTGSEEDGSVIAPLETSKEILKVDDKVTIIFVKPANVEDAESIAEEIERSFDDVEAMTEKEAARKAEEFTGQLSVLSVALGSIAAIIAGLGITNVMFMSVRERKKEIGVMKALGASTYEILSEVLLEAIVITLAGALIGVLLSFATVSGLNAALGGNVATITAGLIIWSMFFAVALACISGFLPAREAAGLQPAAVLRYE